MNTYTVALNKNGQVTLPKELREFLGVEGAKKITFRKRKDEVTIGRNLSYEEFRAEMDKHISAKTRKIIEEDRKKGITTVAQIREEIAKSPKEQKRLEEEYGPRPSKRYA